MNDEFGQGYAEVVAKDLVLTDHGDRSGEQLLAIGEDPKVVWLAICRASGVPKSRWHGINKAKPKK
ncbi:MAG: DUF3046 domain-containing protein [Rhodoluna sp.]